jgi:preprotein translocase subunit YajC
MFINEAMAQTAQNAAEAMPEGSVQKMILQFAIILAVFYFILIRPQTKRMKEHKAEINALSVGDKVLCGGIFGKIVKVSETEAEVEIADGVVIKVLKDAISSVVKNEKTSNDNGKNKRDKVANADVKGKNSESKKNKASKAEKLKEILNND